MCVLFKFLFCSNVFFLIIIFNHQNTERKKLKLIKFKLIKLNVIIHLNIYNISKQQYEYKNCLFIFFVSFGVVCFSRFIN